VHERRLRHRVPADRRRRPGDPATWNAFDGLWGSADCLAGAYCDRSDPPASPAQQPRFVAPWCSDFHQVGPGLTRWQPTGCSSAELRAKLGQR
jgi:hypothetical protein